jgi:hypothetical protein
MQLGVGAPEQEWNDDQLWMSRVRPGKYFLAAWCAGDYYSTAARAVCSVWTRMKHSLEPTCMGGISAASALLHAATCVQAQETSFFLL